MPSIRYYNQTAPFWDFVARMENQGADHPFFGGRNDQQNDNSDGSDIEHPTNAEQPFPHPPWAFGSFGPMPHRGRHAPHPPPPPPPPGPPGAGDDKAPPPPEYDDPPVSQPDDDDGQPGPSHPRHHHRDHHGPGRRWAGRGRGWGHGWGGRGRCGYGGQARGNPFGEGFPFRNFGPFADVIQQAQSQFFGGNGNEDDKGSTTFKPEVDVFDTAESFVIHISLPGAKKEDVGVDWDAEKSEIRIAGVVYRPGDEDFIKTLALNERSVGEFERKVRLGSRANPAQVDADGITAKLEDGILKIDVPKLDSGYVEVKKVDIE